MSINFDLYDFEPHRNMLNHIQMMLTVEGVDFYTHVLVSYSPIIPKIYFFDYGL